MCGIAGFITDSSSFDREKVLERMTESIRHRGPDGGGYYVDSHAALGHRRLSIVDIAAGQQPMANEDDDRPVAFMNRNGVTQAVIVGHACRQVCTCCACTQREHETNEGAAKVQGSELVGGNFICHRPLILAALAGQVPLSR